LSPPIFRSTQNIVTDKGLVIISVPRAPLFCKTLQSYNSPGARARELLKPSTDLATSSCWDRKNLFFGLGHLWVTSQVVIIAKSLQRVFLRLFGHLYPGLGAIPLSHVLAQVVFEN